jgi:four helix bundle protein
MSESVYKKDNLILNLTFDFAIDAITFCELLEERKKFVVARQLLRSATSVGANIREAQNAESKADFIHKMKIAAKEADETEYWLLICKAAKDYPYNDRTIGKTIIGNKDFK